jgi:hypothetical protein
MGDYVQPEEIAIQCMMLSEYIFRLEQILHTHGDLPVTRSAKGGHAKPAAKPEFRHLAGSVKRKFVSHWNDGMKATERFKSIPVVRICGE